VFAGWGSPRAREVVRLTERSIRLRWGLLGVGAFALLLALEVLTEDEPMELADLLGEALQIGLLVAAATGVSLLTGRVAADREEKAALVHDLEVARAEGQAWRQSAQSYLSGLGEEIQKQFDTWQLTPAEREVGLLMLKGFSHRELASLRGTTEATVRHQAQSIYQKSSLAGRSAFCAYFLEDLLPARGHDVGQRPSA
jgi:DNA-binding CsgD family transcriptional regulator